MDSLVKLLVGILPGSLWLIIFFQIFKKGTSASLKKLFLVFCWGAIFTIPALLLEVGVESFFPPSETSLVVAALSSVFLVAPIEEIMKYVLLRFGALRQYGNEKVYNPIIFGIAIGLGFATVENVLLVFQESSFSFIALRAITATLLHAGATSIVGFYLGLSQKDPSRRLTFAFQGIFIASLFHGAYNFVMTLQETSAVLLALLLLIGMFVFLGFAVPELRKMQEVERSS